MVMPFHFQVIAPFPPEKKEAIMPFVKAYVAKLHELIGFAGE